MAKRVLAIGVGGSGKSAVTILKERLEESYGLVPENVVLLSLDTDSLRPEDKFGGTQLSPVFDERGRQPEFQHVVSPGGMTMDTVFADITSGKTTAYMQWLEKDKLDRILGPAERDIRGGAQQRRPVGRTALFLRWTNPIYQSIHEAITRVYGDPEEEEPAVDTIDIEKGKRLIFIVGSVAGALVFYALGKLFGEPRVRLLMRRYGRWLMLSEGDFDTALEWFDRYGERVIFFGRMVPIVRSLISIPAGIAGMNLTFFALYTALGTGLWSFLLAFAGYLLGRSWPLVSEWVGRYEKAAIIIGALAIIIFFARRLLQRRQLNRTSD